MTAQSISVSGIYKITNSANQNFYLGSAVNFKKRWGLHLRDLGKGIHCNPGLQRAFNKYGVEVLSFSIVEYVIDAGTLLSREQHWLDSFASLRTCYNVCKIAGSRLGSKVTDASRKLMSESATGKVISPEHRASISAAMMGRKHSPEHSANFRAARIGLSTPKMRESQLGRKRSPETIEKQRASLTGRKQPADEIARRVASMTGQKRTDAARENMSMAQKGRPKSPETIEKIRATLTGKKHSQATIDKRKESIRLVFENRRLARETI